MKEENNNYQHCKGYVGQGLVEISGLKISLWISSCVYTYHMSEKLNEMKTAVSLNFFTLDKHQFDFCFSAPLSCTEKQEFTYRSFITI